MLCPFVGSGVRTARYIDCCSWHMDVAVAEECLGWVGMSLAEASLAQLAVAVAAVAAAAAFGAIGARRTQSLVEAMSWLGA